MAQGPEADFMKRILSTADLKEKTQASYGSQKKEPLYTEIKGSYFFVKAEDKFGKYHYLSADSEEAIEDYCENGVLGDSLAICNWITYVDPIMVAFHFKWVGKGRSNPFVIAKPFKYKGPTKWTWDKKERT
tara:strand:- start:250 stop:642 length:393 start_codon:yes stop_codon:yes gene_type:complete